MKDFDPRRYFLKPTTTDHRRYEALRAYYFEDLTQEQVAERFSYSVNTIQALVRDFTHGKIVFFLPKKYGPKRRQTPDSVRNKIVAMRKRNLSTPEIAERLAEQDIEISTRTIERIIKEEGFSKLPRRTFKQRARTKKMTYIPEKTRQLDFQVIEDMKVDCQIAGIYFFIPYILKTGFHNLIEASSFPSTTQLSNLNYILSVLSLKLIGQERLSQINNYNFDHGFGLFAGLNVLPKATAIGTYSYGIDKGSVQSFQDDFVSGINKLDKRYYDGETINLDFHIVPHYGDLSVMEKHWSTIRGKSIKSALTFFAHDGESKMLSYTNTDIKREEASHEIKRFVNYWIGVKGVLNKTLVFDSKLTTYPVLSQLNEDGVKFLTLRRRGPKEIEKVLSIPRKKWERITVNIPKRKHKSFLVYSRTIPLPKHSFKVRETIIRGHGRDKPTFVITNNFDFDQETTVTLYARRWRIENTIAELVDFFSLNALSSPIMIRIYFDVLLTMVAATLYKLIAEDLRGFEKCEANTVFSRFINTPGKIIVDGKDVIVKMRKRAHTPILRSSEVFKRAWEVPWWGKKRVSFKWVA